MTDTIYIWNAKCDTDNMFYKAYTEDENAPTVCPNNAAHGVVVNDTYLIRKISAGFKKLTNADEDGRLIVSPGLFPDYMNPYHTSEGDDFDNGVRGGGDRLVLKHADGASVENITEIRFIDYIQMLGGGIRVYNSNADDYVSFDCYSPATTTTPNGGGTGNCNLVATGYGFNIIIPAPGDGAHDVDLTTPVNANLAGSMGQPILVTAATPVTAVDEENVHVGYWDWDRKTGAITPNYTGSGGYNLYDAQITLSRYVNRVCVYNGDNTAFVLDLRIEHRGGPFLPHWVCRLYTTRASSHAGSDPPVFYAVNMVVARAKST